MRGLINRWGCLRRPFSLRTSIMVLDHRFWRGGWSGMNRRRCTRFRLALPFQLSWLYLILWSTPCSNIPNACAVLSKLSFGVSAFDNSSVRTRTWYIRFFSDGLEEETALGAERPLRGLFPFRRDTCLARSPGIRSLSELISVSLTGL